MTKLHIVYYKNEQGRRQYVTEINRDGTPITVTDDFHDGNPLHMSYEEALLVIKALQAMGKRPQGRIDFNALPWQRNQALRP